MKNEKKKDSKLKLKMRHIDGVPRINTELRGGDITEDCGDPIWQITSQAKTCGG